ncbi:WhiB family transcriptional regulator [Streptomyces albogriseolus]
MTTHTRLPRTPATLVPADTGDWRDDAACRVHPEPDLWHPVSTRAPDRARTEEAKRVCLTRCAVREQCLQYALDERLDEGVWGGLSEQERRRLHRRRVQVYDRRFVSAVDYILGHRLEEFRELEGRGLVAAEIAKELGTNATTVNAVRERLAAQAPEEVAA